MHRFTTVAGAAAAIVTLAAAPALAHEEINPKTFPTGQPTFFTLSAANEAKADLVKIVLAAPKGTAFGEATREPAGWTVNRTDDQVTWTGGAVKPEHFDQWGFEIEGADQPGTLAYKVTLGFAGGKTDDVEVDVTAVPPSSGGSASPRASPPASAETTTTLSVTTTTGATGAATDLKTAGGQTRANAALGVGIIALVLAAAALARSVRGGPTGPAPAGGEPGRPGRAQDW
jgi:hypothetical protein